MYKIKNIINKIRRLNKEQKEKRLITIFVFIMIIYFVSSNVLNINGKSKEEGNNSLSSSEFSKKEETIDEISNEKIYIHITGEVKNPGVLKINDGTRLADVIEKAGGIKENGDIKYLNLAKKVQDGEKIYIPNKKEITEFEKGQMEEKIGDTARYIEENSISKEKNAKNENKTKEKEKNKNIININKASKEELIKIPGIGDITAQKIIEKRKKNGDFKNIEEIKSVEGIGEAKFEKIKNNICI